MNRCRCDHNALAHRDHGTGACEGVYTYFDGEAGPCPCQRFTGEPTAEQRAALKRAEREFMNLQAKR